ncbi:MAG: hypothetical protein KDB00_04565 [Planctomycetales bacterium]|nr:hypothetical protein [Planctomycetales bacterium]
MLTSTSNPTVKHLVKLRDNRARRRAGRILVDGWRELDQALRAGLTPLGIYVCGESSIAIDSSFDTTGNRRIADATHGQEGAEDLHDRLPPAVRDTLVTVSDAVMKKIAYGQSARGVVAEFQAPRWGLGDLRLGESGLILVLDRFEKPGNVGAAFRCADAAGADAVILTPSTADRFNPNAIRSSLGAVFSVPSAVADEDQAKAWLAAEGFRLWAARVETSRVIWEADLTGRVAMIIGSEADGLGDHWCSDEIATVESLRIPMAGDVDSLNASVSAALFLFEATRQRTEIAKR